MTVHQTEPATGQSDEQAMLQWSVPPTPAREGLRLNATIDMGWGRLLFGQTFDSNRAIADTLCEERPGQRDIAFYLSDPHVVLALAPHRLFLDPSHTYRVWRSQYTPSPRPLRGFHIREVNSGRDAEEVNRIYASWQMVTAEPAFILDQHARPLLHYLVAEHDDSGAILGTVTGVDHVEAFNDPDRGASLWCLAVDAQCDLPGVGEALVRATIEQYFDMGRRYLDLSVMHDNEHAIALYEKLGFERIPIFAVKHKNPINEPLFIAPAPEERLNPYASIIVDEARRRGIGVEVIDAEMGYFRLTMGGRSITCRESLTELTSAIAMSRCDDKRVTRRVLEHAGLRVPAQQDAKDPHARRAFLERYRRVVVKPARGEQGAGISVDVRTAEEVDRAVELAQRYASDVVIEQFVEGQDLRVVVINAEVVAAAVRRPPVVTGTGGHSIRQLIEKYNRRREAATGGESHVPLDGETQRCVRTAGWSLDDVLPAGESLQVRKTANLHTGGTIHDVTAELHPHLAEASIRACEAIGIPVAGLDLLVPDPAGEEYVFVEVNERVGLANHEPQPTAQRFVDFLFPASAKRERP
jgi:GNAT-family acetyltransferase (TIGR03103 family)